MDRQAETNSELRLCNDCLQHLVSQDNVDTVLKCYTKLFYCLQVEDKLRQLKRRQTDMQNTWKTGKKHSHSAKHKQELDLKAIVKEIDHLNVWREKLLKNTAHDGKRARWVN